MKNARDKIMKMAWNADYVDLWAGWPNCTDSDKRRPTDKIFSHLKFAAKVNGKWLEPDMWSITSDGYVRAVINDIELRLEIKSADETQEYHWLRGGIVNISSQPIVLGGFRFYQVRSAGQNDFLSIPGSRMRLYREGWTMTSPAGTVRYGENDFNINPEYLPFAISLPDSYESSISNHFSAEYVTVLNDSETEMSVLVGFITSADHITQISAELDIDGIANFEANSSCDEILVESGKSVFSEEMVIMVGYDGYGLLEKFAEYWGRHMKAIMWDHVPTGWCSWYYYFDKITEADIFETLDELKTGKHKLSLEYIQIDHGYQAAFGDWLECNSKFPSGMQHIAEQIKLAGYKPGIWLAPFMVEEGSNLYASNPDWMIKNKDGETIWVTEFGGSRIAVPDCTKPEVLEWLVMIFDTLSSWGFEYVKLDFLMYESSVMNGVYSDPHVTRVQALRKGLQAIRTGMGDKFILACTSPLGPTVGLVNGERIATDIAPMWAKPNSEIYKEALSLPNVCRNIINRRYMHGKLWLNDPDTHIARIDNNELTEDEVILWTSALWLVGGLTFLGDRLATLSKDREKLSRLLLESADSFYARPLDFFENEFPAIWLARPGKSAFDNEELMLGLFNFENRSKTFYIDWKRLGIPADRVVEVSDFWAEKTLGQKVNSVSIQLNPHSCNLLKLILLN